MMSKLRLALPLLLALLMLQSCDPRFFQLGQEQKLDVRVIGDWNNVSHTQSAVTLSDGATIRLNRLYHTEYNFFTLVRLTEGSGFGVMIRTKIADATIQDSGVVIDLTTSGSRARLHEETIAKDPGIRLPHDTTLVLNVYSDNEYLRVTLGCDTLVQQHIPLIESDDILFYAHPGSTVQLLNPAWVSLHPD